MSEKQVVFSLSLCLFSLLLLFRLPFLLDDIVKAKNKAEVASIPNEKSEEKKYLDVERWTICFVMRFRFSVDRDPVRFHHFSSIRTFGFLISIEMQWIAHRNERMMLLFISFLIPENDRLFMQLLFDSSETWQYHLRRSQWMIRGQPAKRNVNRRERFELKCELHSNNKHNIYFYHCFSLEFVHADALSLSSLGIVCVRSLRLRRTPRNATECWWMMRMCAAY